MTIAISAKFTAFERVLWFLDSWELNFALELSVATRNANVPGNTPYSHTKIFDPGKNTHLYSCAIVLLMLLKWVTSSVEILSTSSVTLMSLTLRGLSLRKVHVASGFNSSSVIIFFNGNWPIWSFSYL